MTFTGIGRGRCTVLVRDELLSSMPKLPDSSSALTDAANKTPKHMSALGGRGKMTVFLRTASRWCRAIRP